MNRLRETKRIPMALIYMMNKQEYLKQLRDHKFYLEHLCQIKTKEKGLQPFILNEAQKDIFNVMRKHCRVIILKARQLGFSTAIAGFIYVDTIMRPGITSALVGYNSDMVIELLDKIRTFHRTTPEELRPTVHFDSKYEMSFPAMDSKILVLPNTKNVGRGLTLQNVLITELSSWDDAEEKMTGLVEAVPESGRIIVEATPRGQGSLYHRMWMVDNNYIKKDYGWWWGYTKEQMNAKKREIGEMRYNQEYGLEFLSTGRNVFDTKVIKAHRKNVLKVGDINKLIEEGQEDFVVREEDGWIIYRDPEEGGMYLIGGDPSEGVVGGDYSVATIFNRKTGEEVAMYRGYLPPDRLGDLLDTWGRKYNNALMVVEVNNHGLTTITTLKQKIYPNLYFRPSKFETLSIGVTDRIGWRTTHVTRPLLIDELAKVVREGDMTIHSKITLDEMSVFIYNDNGDMIPSVGFGDDCIFSVGIALQGFKSIYTKKLSQIDESKHLPQNFAY